MSWENERAKRMTKIIELLQANPQGLTLQTIAKETECLREITKERLIAYIDELAWSGNVAKLRDGRIRWLK